MLNFWQRKRASFLAQHPRLRAHLRNVRFVFWKRKVDFKSKLCGLGINPVSLLWVDPRKILKIGIGWGKYKKQNELGRIVGGDWDLSTQPFEDLDVYQSLKARFVHGAKWEDTSHHRTTLERLARGDIIWGIHNKDDLIRRLGNLDCLYEEIKQHGYKTQQLLGNNCSLGDEVSVRIGRNGELLFEDGRHRLAIAKILGLPKIPVSVTWRHKKWYLFRGQILDFARHHGGKFYQPITHPDLSDISAAHGDTRFELIRSSIPFKGGSLLDIGASQGYFCHRFEDEGFRCYAVEKSLEDFYFLNKLRIAEGRRFTAVHADIFEFWEKSEFDVVLALNIFHHFLKTAETYEKLVQLLRRFKTRLMFFEPHCPDEAQMHGAYRNFDNEEFVRFVAENSGLTQREFIGYGEEGRPIYKLTGD